MDSGISKALSGSSSVASSAAKKLKMTVGTPPRPAVSYKPFSELTESENGVIQAMVCRAWETKTPYGKYIGTEFILGDDQGAALHCIARSSIAHWVVPKLQVGHIYSISKFSLGHNKETFRVRRDDEYIIHLEGNTVIHKVECSTAGYVRHPFQLVPIEEIVFNGSKYLIDVIGRVVSLGAIKPTRNGSQYIDLHLLNERGRTVKATLWGALCEEISSRCQNASSLYVIILPAMNIREFKGAIQLSSTSGTSIYDSLDIADIANLHQLMREAPVPPPENSVTLLQLLQLGRAQKEETDAPSVTFICRVRVVGIRPRNSWNYYSCGLGGCRKGLTPHTDHFWCESCEKKIEFPLLRFRLHLDISDGSTTIAATVFDEMAELLAKKKAQSLMESLGEAAAANDLPNDILRLAGTEHTFEFKSHTYYNHGLYESFTVSRIVQYDLPEHPSDSSTELLEKPTPPYTTALANLPGKGKAGEAPDERAAAVVASFNATSEMAAPVVVYSADTTEEPTTDNPATED